MSRSTVVYTHGGGRLGNQLIRFAHWIAWAHEHEEKVQVLNFAFWPYAALFAKWSEYPACGFPVRRSRITCLARTIDLLPLLLRRRIQGGRRVARLLHQLGRRWPGWQAIELDDTAGESIELDDPLFLERILAREVTTCAGWKISSWKLFDAHEGSLRKFFHPARAWSERNDSFIADLRQRHDYLIAVLIRQTDYRQWHGGRFCYSTEEYSGWMKQLLDLRLGRKPAFVIASDEYQDPNALVGLPYYYSRGAVNEGGHWFESFLALSLCDLIVSPPSTFSAAAAFVGNVPILPLIERSQPLSTKEMLHRAMLDASRHPVFSLAVK